MNSQITPKENRQNKDINNNNENQSSKILKEIKNLPENEKLNIINNLIGSFQSNGCNQNNFLQNEIIQEEYEEKKEEETQLLQYKQLSRQELNKMLDYKDCWDFYYSAIATIENIALGKSNKKEYGYWDEFDACSFKSKKDLVIQLLKILKCFKGAFNDYLEDYNDIIDYPEDLNIIHKKLEKWKKIINDKNINKYIDELINIVNQRGELNLQEELNYYYNKKIREKDIRKGFENIMKCSHEVRKEEIQLQEEYEKNGEISIYDVTDKLNIPSGRSLPKNK
jgi:hypothetical protein